MRNMCLKLNAHIYQAVAHHAAYGFNRALLL